MCYLYVNKYVASNSRLYNSPLRPLETANVAYCQRNIQLSGNSAYPDISSSHLIQISAVLLYASNL